ncbi:MAG: peptide ABC transporter substrate-binding protein [Verrucomicrobiota bacterium]
MRFKKTVLIHVFRVALLVILTGCTREDSAGGAGDANVLRVGNGTEPAALDPQITTGVSEFRIASALLEGLVSESPAGNGTAPGVASSWETSDDKLTWTFHLRPDARWSDGDPVVAGDFLRAYERMLSPELAADYAYRLFDVVGAEDFNAGRLKDFAQTGFAAPDDHTLVVRLRHPVPFLLALAKHHSWYPLHFESIRRHGDPFSRGNTGWTRPGEFVGNGPFRLKEWLPGQQITVMRNTRYWDAANVKLDAIEFHAIDNPDAEEAAFRTGRLDVTYSLPLGRTDTYREEHPDKLRIDPYYGTYFYRLNTAKPPLDDVRVRHALAMTINRQAICEHLLRAGQEPALHFTPHSPGYQARASLEEDAAKARRLLAEAGFPGGKGFPRLELLYNTRDDHKQIAEAVQQMWKRELGIDIVLRNEEWKVYLETVNRGDYQIARAGWIGDFPDPHTFLDLWVTGGGNNRTGYSNAEYDRLFGSVLSQGDEAARLAVCQQLDALLVRDVPVIPIYFYKRVYALDPRVEGWVPDVLDNRAWKHIGLAGDE